VVSGATFCCLPAFRPHSLDDATTYLEDAALDGIRYRLEQHVGPAELRRRLLIALASLAEPMPDLNDGWQPPPSVSGDSWSGSPMATRSPERPDGSRSSASPRFWKHAQGGEDARRRRP
jgi:hypothetical protein